MGGLSHSRCAAAIIAAVCALALPAAAHAADPPKAEIATTGNDSELLSKVPISKQPGTRERVAMRLGPDQLKPIQVGDRLRASAEVQVSTTCAENGPRCIGRSYQANPTITAKIVLSPSLDATSGYLPLSESRSVLCKQRRPNRNHHCTIAIPNTETTVTDLGALPCPPDACYVNLIVGATSKKSKKGDVVVLGADRPDRTVQKDKGRLNVVQARAKVPGPPVTSNETLVNSQLPLTEGKKEKRRVVYSVPVPAPRKGEVLAFDARFLADISDLRFNTFIGSRVLMALDPTATTSEGLAKTSIPLRGQATESNGFNCTLGASGFANPCTTVKAGAARISRDVIDEATGLPATLYLNVVASAKPLLAEKVDPAHQVGLGALPGGLTVARYAP
jgi:hypothetical protein